MGPISGQVGSLGDGVLEEIAGEAGEIFHENGGEKFTHIPCLNDSDDGMKVIEAVVRRELHGWI